QAGHQGRAGRAGGARGHACPLRAGGPRGGAQAHVHRHRGACAQTCAQPLALPAASGRTQALTATLSVGSFFCVLLVPKPREGAILTSMKDSTPVVIHREDYRPAPYTIEAIDLDIDLDEHATTVR